MIRKPIIKATTAILFFSFTMVGCTGNKSSYPTGPSDRGWRWPATVSNDGRHLNPPGTFGVLQVWLGDTPPSPKTRSDQITEIANAVNQQVVGPITFLIVTWKGPENDLHTKFFEEFLDMEEPQLFMNSYSADPTQIKAGSAGDDKTYMLKTLKTEGQPSEFSKFRFQVEYTTDALYGRDDDYYDGGKYRGGSTISLYVNPNLPPSGSQINITDNESGFADVYLYQIEEGEHWKHWTLFPLYWENEKLFGARNDAANTPAGAALFPLDGGLYMVWGEQMMNSVFQVATLASDDDPTDFTPYGSRREIISPNNYEPIGSYFSPSVAIFRGKIFLAWKTRENGELRIMRSDPDDFAQSPGRNSHIWRFNDLSGTGPTLVNVGGRKLIVAYRGRLYDIINGDYPYIYFRESFDGETWSDPRVVFCSVSGNSSPSLAYLNRRLVLVFKDKSESKVYLSYSDDDGATWSNAQLIAQGAAYESGFYSPTLFALDSGDRGLEVLWENPDDLFYLFDGSRVTSFRSDQTSFDDLQWRRWTSSAGRSSAVYFDFRFFVVTVNLANDNYLELFVSPQESELALPWLAS